MTDSSPILEFIYKSCRVKIEYLPSTQELDDDCWRYTATDLNSSEDDISIWGDSSSLSEAFKDVIDSMDGYNGSLFKSSIAVIV